MEIGEVLGLGDPDLLDDHLGDEVTIRSRRSFDAGFAFGSHKLAGLPSRIDNRERQANDQADAQAQERPDSSSHDLIPQSQVLSPSAFRVIQQLFEPRREFGGKTGQPGLVNQTNVDQVAEMNPILQSEGRELHRDE